MTTDEMFEFDLPDAVRTSVRNLEHFVETEIRPLETEGDNARFFDHRREWARTDFENGGVPSAPWRDLLAEMHRRADAAGGPRGMLPGGGGGEGGSHLPPAALRGEGGVTAGRLGKGTGITAFMVRSPASGVTIDRFTWTMNLPTDHAEITLDQAEVPDSAVLGPVNQALEMVQLFVHRNRMRQAAASLGAARFCIERSVTYANQRSTWGTPLSRNQAIQFPWVELHSEATMLRWLVRPTAPGLDGEPLGANLSELVAMSNYRANRLACDAADQAIQVHGANGYSRDEPLELIYRHHRRYRITEGAEEIQIRRVAQGLFGLKSLAVRIK